MCSNPHVMRTGPRSLRSGGRIGYLLPFAIAFVIMLESAKAYADNSKISVVAIGVPMMKVQVRSTGTYLQPTFVPGPGLGYIWDSGRLGIVAFPGIGVLDRQNIMLAPHLTFHAYFISVGLGYEFRFSNTNSQELKLSNANPIFIFGVTIPVQAWMQK